MISYKWSPHSNVPSWNFTQSVMIIHHNPHRPNQMQFLLPSLSLSRSRSLAVDQYWSIVTSEHLMNQFRDTIVFLFELCSFLSQLFRIITFSSMKKRFWLIDIVIYQRMNERMVEEKNYRDFVCARIDLIEKLGKNKIKTNWKRVGTMVSFVANAYNISWK